jgi:DNA-binding response OmpR family regulator
MFPTDPGTIKTMPTTGTILLAEDEKPLAKALELKLTSAGLKVKVVHDGQEAVEALDKEQFVMLLMDLIMPRMDGFGLLEHIKKNKIKIPVIVLTNLGQQEDRDRVFKLGASEYFVKADMQLSEIVERVQKLLGG